MDSTIHTPVEARNGDNSLLSAAFEYAARGIPVFRSNSDRTPISPTADPGRLAAKRRIIVQERLMARESLLQRWVGSWVELHHAASSAEITPHGEMISGPAESRVGTYRLVPDPRPKWRSPRPLRIAGWLAILATATCVRPVIGYRTFTPPAAAEIWFRSARNSG